MNVVVEEFECSVEKCWYPINLLLTIIKKNLELKMLFMTVLAALNHRFSRSSCQSL